MNILDLLIDHNVDHRIHGEHRNVRPGYVGLECPFCSSEPDKYYLGVEIDTGRCSCWKCGPKSVTYVLSQVCGIPYKKIKGELPKFIRGSETAQDALRRASGRLTHPPLLSPLTKPYRAYLRHRGFDPDEIQRLWGVKCTKHVGRYAWRLWIPVRMRDVIVSWTTRSIGDNEAAKYVSAKPDQEIVPHKNVLYGAELARHTIVICEGPLDAWAIGPGAVSTFGLKVTEEQMVKMSAFPERIVLQDREPGIYKRACNELAETLGMFPGKTYVVELESGNDPASCDPREIRSFRKEFGI